MTKVRPHQPPPAAPPPPPVSPPPSPPPPPAAKLGDPEGTIGGPLRVAFGRGAPWDNVNRFDDLFLAAGAKHGVPPAMLKAMAVIESGGQMIPNAQGSGAFGIMQIKSAIWGERARALGYDLATPGGQIGMAAAILGGAIAGVTGTTPEERFLSTYYPTPGLDVPGEDGATPRQYLADMHELMRQIDAAAKGITPAPPADVLDLIYGGKPYIISAYYGQLVTWSCPGCYTYFTAYGLDTAHHWAYDISAEAGDGAPLYAPFDGKVVCAGTGVGEGAWGTGCAAFGRVNNYGGAAAGAGSGRLELLHHDGDRSLILGHALNSVVHPGDLVAAGDLVGHQGGMNASHVHAEGRFANGTRIGDIRVLFGGGAAPVERVPYDFNIKSVPPPNLFTVRADRKLTVYQRADTSSLVASSVEKGETFQAVAIVPGNDGKEWFLSVYNGRVPRDGTTIV